MRVKQREKEPMNLVELVHLTNVNEAVLKGRRVALLSKRNILEGVQKGHLSSSPYLTLTLTLSEFLSTLRTRPM